MDRLRDPTVNHFFVFMATVLLAIPMTRTENCTSCVPGEVLADQLRQLRIEAVKQLILDRLEMEGRPRDMDPGERRELPAVFLQQVGAEDDNEEGANDDTGAGDEVARLSSLRQLILFPVKIWQSRTASTAVLKFSVTSEMRRLSLHSAILWTAKTLNIPSKQSSWRARDMTTIIDRQIEQRIGDPFLNLHLNVSINALKAVGSSKPYLVVQVDPYRKRPNGQELSDSTRRPGRRKRSTPMCGSGVTQCCRDSLYISFQDIGWSDWILAPQGFHAYYCRGSCRSAASVAASSTQHTSLLQVP